MKIKVKNHSCIRRLSLRSMWAAKTRNIIAVMAIALTAILFTSLFTIAMSINESFQDSNFRQVGSYAHGGFKYLTKEQYQEFRDDPLIREFGIRRMVGLGTGESLAKNQVEVSWCDEKDAKWMYCEPIEGRLPKEGTKEAATDLEVLNLLGVEPEIGTEFTVPILVDDKIETSQTFTLCGWWEKDPVAVANHVLIPQSRVEDILKETKVTIPGETGMTGCWNMDVMLGSSMHIEEDLRTILENHGYQNASSSKDNYIAIGINWGYMGAQMNSNFDLSTVLAVILLLLLIIFTGYLIIYNVFQISVANEIRFYGLLKTIGVTGRQIRRIIRIQALLLSLLGIPLGLLCGWLIGAKLTPIVLSQLSGVGKIVSIHPIIFIASAIFALLTVLVSCHKPGKLAGMVSPVEALHYTETAQLKKKTKKSGKKWFLLSMAKANLGRNRKKTVITVVSLALALVLLNLTVTFTNGFDMDKYLSNIITDGIVARASYFRMNWDKIGLSQEVIADISTQPGVTEGGRIYGDITTNLEYVSEEYWRKKNGEYNQEEELDRLLELRERNEKGEVQEAVQLYGMEEFVLDKLRVVEGDLSRLYEPGGHYVAAVLSEDDYGKEDLDSSWAKVGDRITFRHVDELEFYNRETGEILDMPEDEIPYDVGYGTRPKKYRDVEYEVAARVVVPSSLSYRYYGMDEFVLNAQTFVEETRSQEVLLYTFDTKDKKASENMDAFLEDYTESVHQECDFESRQSYVREFEGFRSMFLLMGGTLSFVVGLVGVLNFFNAILTGIITRKREFAMLQSIGMTGKQLKKMLVWEGLFYALGAAAAAFLLSLFMSPVTANILTNMFWFFTYRFTIFPVLLAVPILAVLGLAIPLVLYRQIARKSIVERLRENE